MKTLEKRIVETFECERCGRKISINKKLTGSDVSSSVRCSECGKFKVLVFKNK